MTHELIACNKEKGEEARGKDKVKTKRTKEECGMRTKEQHGRRHECAKQTNTRGKGKRSMGKKGKSMKAKDPEVTEYKSKWQVVHMKELIGSVQTSVRATNLNPGYVRRN